MKPETTNLSAASDVQDEPIDEWDEFHKWLPTCTRRHLIDNDSAYEGWIARAEWFVGKKEPLSDHNARPTDGALPSCPFCNAPVQSFDTDFVVNHKADCYITVKFAGEQWLTPRMLRYWNKRFLSENGGQPTNASYSQNPASSSPKPDSGATGVSGKDKEWEARKVRRPWSGEEWWDIYCDNAVVIPRIEYGDTKGVLPKLIARAHNESLASLRSSLATVEAEEKRKPLILTAQEIRHLAEFCGMVVRKPTSSEAEEELETEIVIASWPMKGVQGDDGMLPPHKHIAYYEEYPDEGCIPLGTPARDDVESASLQMEPTSAATATQSATVEKDKKADLGEPGAT